MECERFKQLLKSWYSQVQDEALAPARMVDFMEQHITECPVCMMDPEAKSDIKKIITLVLPKDKLKPATRTKKAAADTATTEGPENKETSENEGTGDSEGTNNDDEDRDEFAEEDDDSSAPEDDEPTETDT